MAIPDWKFVQDILERTEEHDTETRAKEIAKKLGKRIRQRRRDDEDFSRAAVPIVREATERG